MDFFGKIVLTLNPINCLVFPHIRPCCHVKYLKISGEKREMGEKAKEIENTDVSIPLLDLFLPLDAFVTTSSSSNRPCYPFLILPFHSHCRQARIGTNGTRGAKWTVSGSYDSHPRHWSSQIGAKLERRIPTVATWRREEAYVASAQWAGPMRSPIAKFSKADSEGTGTAMGDDWGNEILPLQRVASLGAQGISPTEMLGSEKTNRCGCS